MHTRAWMGGDGDVGDASDNCHAPRPLCYPSVPRSSHGPQCYAAGSTELGSCLRRRELQQAPRRRSEQRPLRSSQGSKSSTQSALSGLTEPRPAECAPSTHGERASRGAIGIIVAAQHRQQQRARERGRGKEHRVREWHCVGNGAAGISAICPLPDGSLPWSAHGTLALYSWGLSA